MTVNASKKADKKAAEKTNNNDKVLLFFILIMLLTAIPSGFFAGLFGIGGGLITVPFLFFIFEVASSDFPPNWLSYYSLNVGGSCSSLLRRVSCQSRSQSVDGPPVGLQSECRFPLAPKSSVGSRWPTIRV